MTKYHQFQNTHFLDGILFLIFLIVLIYFQKLIYLILEFFDLVSGVAICLCVNYVFIVVYINFPSIYFK